MESRDPVRVAVIPAAGQGRRWLPATRVVPKELLPLGTYPLIHHAVAEAAAVGLLEVCLILSPAKEAIRQYFEGEKAGARGLVEDLRRDVGLSYRYQREPRGVADAICCARDVVGDDPFCVILPDTIYYGPEPPLRSLVAAHQTTGLSTVGLVTVSADEAPVFDHAGLVDLVARDDGYQEIRTLYSKREGPLDIGAQPEVYRAFPRHVYTPRFFELVDEVRGARGERDDVPILQQLAREGALLGVPLPGKGYDLGNPRGFRHVWERYGGHPGWEGFVPGAAGRPAR